MKKSEYKEQILSHISKQLDKLTVKQIRSLIARHELS